MAKQLRNLEDPYAWARATATALRTGDLNAVDVNEIVEQLDSTAAGLEKELLDHLRDVLEALLLIQFTQADRKQALTSLVEAQNQLHMMFWAAPSLGTVITDDFIDEAYQWARRHVMEDYAVSLPNRCPFERAVILEDPVDRIGVR